MSGITSIMKSANYDDDMPAGWPPTYPDLVNRIKHTSHSVEYNYLEHAEDHCAEGCAQLSKLYEVDRGKAEELAEKICKQIDKWYADVQKFKGPNATPRDF